MDRSPPRTFLEQLVRQSRQTVEEICLAFEATASAHNEDATLSPRQLWRWMAGEVDSARPVAQRVAELHWGYSFDVLIGPPLPGELAPPISRWPHHRPATTPMSSPAQAPQQRAESRSMMERIEHLRQDVHDAIGAGALTEASLDDWERLALRYGRATRYRPAGELLVGLDADLVELKRELLRHQTSTGLRRLTRVTAQMAGLMFLTLIKLNAPVAARNWARTARVAADESDDPRTRAWVRAQEAYVHYYAGDLEEAIEVAAYAQELAGATVSPAVPLQRPSKAAPTPLVAGSTKHGLHCTEPKRRSAGSTLKPSRPRRSATTKHSCASTKATLTPTCAILRRLASPRSTPWRCTPETITWTAPLYDLTSPAAMPTTEIPPLPWWRLHAPYLSLPQHNVTP